MIEASVFLAFIAEIIITTMVAIFTINSKTSNRLVSEEGKYASAVIFGLFSGALLFNAFRIQALDDTFFAGLAFLYASLYIVGIDVSCHQIPWGFTINWILQTVLYIYACGFYDLNYFVILGLLIVISLIICFITMPMNFGFADCWCLTGILMLVLANQLLLPYLIALFIVCLYLFLKGAEHPDEEKYKHVAFIPFYIGIYPIASILWVVALLIANII